MDIRALLRTYRKRLGESQEEFGKRFDAAANTVSRWETGEYEPPLKVIEFVLNAEVSAIQCPFCKGAGSIKF